MVELLEGTTDLFSEAKAEVVLRPEAAAWYKTSFLKDGSIYLNWPGLFEFLVSKDGRRIFCLPAKTASYEAFKTYLSLQALSFALLRQGIEHLHCTALIVNGRAVGLLGNCGSGKSTLAAAFLKAGYPLLTDDLLIVKEEEGSFLAYPGPPRVKLFPEIAQALMGTGVQGTPMNPLTTKLIIPLGPSLHCQSAAPLRAFFVLRPRQPRSSGKKITIRTLNLRRALVDLTANIFNSKIAEPERLKRLLEITGRIANTIPVKSLSYPRDLGRLPEVIEKILLSLPE